MSIMKEEAKQKLHDIIYNHAVKRTDIDSIIDQIEPTLEEWQAVAAANISGRSVLTSKIPFAEQPEPVQDAAHELACNFNSGAVHEIKQDLMFFGRAIQAETLKAVRDVFLIRDGGFCHSQLAQENIDAAIAKLGGES
jgi:hypothetical protein